MEKRIAEEQIMKEIVRILRNEGHSLVVFSKELSTYDGRGVSDLFRLLHEQPETLHGACIADKVVGKGAAALMAMGKVKMVYAELISEPAFQLLKQEGIGVSYGQLVPHIINRSGTGLCPVETRCMKCSTPEECLSEIKSFLDEMKVK